MVKILRLFPDMSFEEIKRKTAINRVIVTKDYTPEFVIGQAVFKERPFSIFTKILKFWKPRRDLLLLIDGAQSCMMLKESEGETTLHGDFGTPEEKKKFIAKMIAKSKADQGPIKTWQFALLAVLIGIVIIIQMMMMRGQTFV